MFSHTSIVIASLTPLLAALITLVGRTHEVDGSVYPPFVQEGVSSLLQHAVLAQVHSA